MSVINLLKIGIKDKLVEMAIEDKLPLDMNDLDMDTIIDEIMSSESGQNAQDFDTFCTLISEEDPALAWQRYQDAEDNVQVGDVIQLAEHMEDYSMWNIDAFHKRFL